MVEKRKFIRHPTDVPLEVWQVTDTSHNLEKMRDISLGGLAFRAHKCWENGTVIGIRISLVDPPFETIGKVAWCQEQKRHFNIGVQFLEENDVTKAHIVEQICQIERYRKMLEKQGRTLTVEEAAIEWISLYGDSFHLES